MDAAARILDEVPDRNGFTPTESAELKRRFDDIQAGRFEEHTLIDDVPAVVFHA